MDSENRQDFEATMATFAHPRYELIATGEVHDGEDAVRAYYASSRAAFGDQRNEVIAIHHADDGVFVEFDLLGTHTGALAGLRRPPDASSGAGWSPCSCSTAIASTASASTSTRERSCASSG